MIWYNVWEKVKGVQWRSESSIVKGKWPEVQCDKVKAGSHNGWLQAPELVFANKFPVCSHLLSLLSLDIHRYIWYSKPVYVQYCRCKYCVLYTVHAITSYMKIVAFRPIDIKTSRWNVVQYSSVKAHELNAIRWRCGTVRTYTTLVTHLNVP